MGGAYNQRRGKFECGLASEEAMQRRFEQRTSTVNVAFLICLDASKVVLLSVVILIKRN